MIVTPDRVSSEVTRWAFRRDSADQIREQAGLQLKHEIAVAPALVPALVVQVAHSVSAAGLRRWFSQLPPGRFGFVVAARVWRARYRSCGS